MEVRDGGISIIVGLDLESVFSLGMMLIGSRGEIKRSFGLDTGRIVTGDWQQTVSTGALWLDLERMNLIKRL